MRTKDAMADLTPVERRAVVHRQRQAISAKMNILPKFAGKVGALIDRMVYEGEDWKTAAKKLGIRLHQARALMGHPKIIGEMQKRAVLLRSREGARNPALAATIRDRGFQEGATAAQQKVSLEAARYLDGTPENGGVVINGGQNVIAGYVIKLDGPSEGPRLGGGQPAREPDFGRASYYDPKREASDDA